MKNKKYLRNSSNIESENRGNGGKIDTPNTRVSWHCTCSLIKEKVTG